MGVMKPTARSQHYQDILNEALSDRELGHAEFRVLTYLIARRLNGWTNEPRAQAAQHCALSLHGYDIFIASLKRHGYVRHTPSATPRGLSAPSDYEPLGVAERLAQSASGLDAEAEPSVA